MDAEFQALQKQNTWNLVPAPPHANLVDASEFLSLNSTVMAHLLISRQGL